MGIQAGRPRQAWSSPRIGPRLELPRPLLTSRSGCIPSPVQAQGGISPGKNVPLHCTTAGSTPLRLDHKGLAVLCQLASFGSAFHPVLVHRLAIYASRCLPTIGHPRAVALHFVHCDQLTAGLAPVGVRPCRAHEAKTPTARLGVLVVGTGQHAAGFGRPTSFAGICAALQSAPPSRRVRTAPSRCRCRPWHS